MGACALYQNEKMGRGERFIAQSCPLHKGNASTSKSVAISPVKRNVSPWAYSPQTDYVRILCLFGGGNPHYLGRLQPETEAAMKEASGGM